MSDWSPRRLQWPWRDFLTGEEAEVVRVAELQSQQAKQQLAEATAILNPIRNRAIHRAKYQAFGKQPDAQAAVRKGGGR